MSDGPYSDVEGKNGRHRKISAPEPISIPTETRDKSRARADTVTDSDDSFRSTFARSFAGH